MIFAKAGDAKRLDPADINEGESSAVTDNLFDTLVKFAPGSTRLVPDLATSWTLSPDGRSWTFELRPHVRFQDGTPFDAAAVVENFDRQRHPLSGQIFEYWQDFFADTVEDMTAIGPLAVRFTLKKPDATFLSNLAMFSEGMVSPAAIRRWGADIGRHPVGTGPFRFVEWIPNEKIVLAANRDYWGGRPYLDRLIFIPVPDPEVRLLELEVGEIDGMEGLSPDDVPQVLKDPELSLLTQPGMNVGYLALNTMKPPLDDARVRLAICEAIDEQALVKAFFAGGELGDAATGLLPPTVWGFDPEIPAYPHDPRHARALLAEAGYPHGLSLSLWALPVARPYIPDGERVAEAIQAELAQVGIRVQLATYEWGTYLDKLADGDHQMAMVGWIGDNGDPDNFLYNMLASANARIGSASNYSFYRNPEVDALLTRAREVGDRAERTRLYWQAQVLIHRDAPVVPLFNARQLAAFRANVHGFALHPTGQKDFWRTWISGGGR